jgi:hypothetical protein
MGLLVTGLLVFCLLAYFLVMLLFPEWIGISRRIDPQSTSAKANATEIKANEINVNSADTGKQSKD